MIMIIIKIVWERKLVMLVPKERYPLVSSHITIIIVYFSLSLDK